MIANEKDFGMAYDFNDNESPCIYLGEFYDSSEPRSACQRVIDAPGPAAIITQVDITPLCAGILYRNYLSYCILLQTE